MKRIAGLLIMLALLSAGSIELSSCGKSSAADTTQSKAKQTVTVQTTTVMTTPMASTLKVTGSIEGIKEATVQSETQGRILSISKTIGDRVAAGTPLVRVDDELKAIALQQATAQRLSAESAFEKAKIDDQRNQQLFNDKALSKSQLELSGLQVKSADAMLKGALSAESLAKRQLADATVKAPFAGVVANRFVNQGEMLAPGTKVETLIDDSRMKFKMYVGELDVVSLKVGDTVSVTVDALGAGAVPGRVQNISDKADQTRSYEVDVEIPNGNHIIKSGMFARAEIQRESKHDVAAVPTEAVIFTGTTAQVYIVQNGVAHLRTVTVGATTPKLVEIVNGLAPGDEVVTFGQPQLHDGSLVRK